MGFGHFTLTIEEYPEIRVSSEERRLIERNPDPFEALRQLTMARGLKYDPKFFIRTRFELDGSMIFQNYVTKADLIGG